MSITRQERYNDQEELFRIALDSLQARLWTALPGIVESFDAEKLTCSVKPSISVRVAQPDGSSVLTELPLLVDVPVHYPTGGGFTLTFPVAQGDECLVVFSTRCIDGWWQSGQVSPEAEYRLHNLSDGFAIVGFRSQVRLLNAVSTSSVQLRSDDGDAYVEVAPGHVINVITPATVNVNAGSGTVNINAATINTTGHLVQNGNVDITGTVNVTGTVTATGEGTFNGGHTVSQHIHAQPNDLGGDIEQPTLTPTG